MDGFVSMKTGVKGTHKTLSVCHSVWRITAAVGAALPWTSGRQNKSEQRLCLGLDPVLRSCVDTDVGAFNWVVSIINNVGADSGDPAAQKSSSGLSKAVRHLSYLPSTQGHGGTFGKSTAGKDLLFLSFFFFF